ncbi:RdlA protein [Streptomyces fimicarius]
MKKMMVTTMLAVGFLGVAPQAMAVGVDGTAPHGGGSVGESGDFRPCLGVPVKENAASLVGLVPVTVLQDAPILPVPNLRCAENSTQSRVEEPQSHARTSSP